MMPEDNDRLLAVLKKLADAFCGSPYIQPAGRLGRHAGRADNDFLRLEE